jgi:predicted esterase
MRGAAWAAVVALYIAAWQVWTRDPEAARPPGAVDVVEARRFGALLKDLALAERVRSWRSDDLASRQAAWIAVKAEYVLNTTRVLDAKVVPDGRAGALLLDTWRRLDRARTLSSFGAQEIPEESGGRLRAYWSAVDNTLQTYSLALPDGYSPENVYPLIVSMHGHGWFGPYQGHPAPGVSGALSLAPQGRGATDYMALGEDDVLTAIEEVCRDYSVDRDRIYLRGGSMGGTGSWHLGVHHAGRFAGILPIVGNADYTAWQTQWGWNAPFEGRNDELRRLVQEAQTPRAFATNLLNLPTYVIHGSADNIVPVEHARRTVAVLRQNGCPVNYLEYPGSGHGGFPGDIEQQALAWLCSFQRDAHPRRVRWAAELMRQGTAYWVRLEEKRAPLGLAHLDAQAIDRSHIVATTQNLNAFAVRRDPVLFAGDRPLFVQVDAERVIFPPGPADAWLSFRYLPGAGWRDASLLPLPPLRKTAALEGPIQEAVQAPFVLVQGTRSPDPLKSALWGVEVRRFANEWKRRNGSPCPFVRDVECSAELADSHNLILFGGADDNTVTAVLEPRLPIARMLRPLTSTALDLGGPANRATPTAADTGWFMVYPNPEHPRRLVVVIAAAGPEAVYQVWGRFGNWFNWGVHDSRKYFDYAVFDALSASPESMRLVGWFGTDWNAETGTWWLGDSRVRARRGPQGFPRRDAPPVDADQFDLVDLRPAAIDQMRGAVGFNRSFQGTPLPGSLGVRAPALLEYDLNEAWKTLECGGLLLNSPEADLLPSRRKSEQVRFIIRGDDRELAAATVSWDQPEVRLVANLNKVKRLKLEAACTGGPSWLHMSAAWLTPRVSR